MRRRAQERRRRELRRRLALAVVLAAAAGALTALLTGGGRGSRSGSQVTATGRSTGARGAVADTTSAGAGSTATGPATAAAGRAAAAKPHHRRRPAAPSPGSLPQTMAFPSAGSAAFKSRMAALWEGVRSGAPASAESAFFPQQAYVQLKSIAGAAADWKNRLVRDYGLDIGAAHALLGSGASRARLERVEVDSAYGHWVAPGVCDNTIGYYEMPGARVVYREDGAVRSFGIASMISWRGEWYVVHLGAVLREGEGGVVDEPASGAGSPAYSGTC